MKKQLFIFNLPLFIALTINEQQSELPKPTGVYKIGTRFLYFIDNNRPDIFTPRPDDFREISVQIWYPAQPDAFDHIMMYGDTIVARNYINMGIFKPSFIESIASQHSYSYLNAKFSGEKKKYPVVIFSASGEINGNFLLFEELASHGYIVVRIGHPHWCSSYYDIYGNKMLSNLDNDEYNKKMWAEENSDTVIKIKRNLTLSKSYEEKLKWQKRLNEFMPIETNDVKLWAEDISFIINKLEELNKLDLYKGCFDLNKIGVMGYSKGGAAAGQACISEKRCKAGVNLSGFMLGDIADKSLDVPFMVIEAVEPWAKDYPPINDLLYYTSKNKVYLVQIDGATHGNFSDLSAWGNKYLDEKYRGVIGVIDGLRFLTIQNSYVVHFFNIYLYGIQTYELEGISKSYPEAYYKFK